MRKLAHTIQIPLLRGAARQFATLVLSRLWYIVITLIAAGCFAAFLLSQERLKRDHASFARDGLLRDQFEVETLLRLEAKARLDALAPLGIDDEVIGWLKRVNARADQKHVDDRSARKLGSHLAKFNRTLGGLIADKLWVVDSKGIVVASSEESGLGLGMHFGMMPAIKKALGGYLKDDVWMFSGRLYRVAARPVIQGGQYIGGLLHLKQLDSAFARSISAQLGGPGVGFYYGQRLVVGIQSIKIPAAFESLIEASLKKNLASAERSIPQNFAKEGYAVLATAFLSSMKDSDLHVVLVRPVANVGGLFGVLTGSTRQDLGKVAWWAVVLLALIAAGMGLFVLWLEHDRFFERFASQLQGLAQGKVERIVTENLGIDYGGLGDTLNQYITRLQGHGGDQRSTEDILSMADGVASSQHASPYFGFSTLQPSEPLHVPRADRPAPPPVPQSLSVKKVGPSRNQPSDSTHESAARRISQLSVEPNTVMSAYPQEPPAQGPSGPVSADVTTVSSMPSEDDMRHYADVYEAFVARSREVGHRVDSLTFEKFLVSIEKTRRSVLEKPGIRNVRFSVHLKDGKPTLRATPVKS